MQDRPTQNLDQRVSRHVVRVALLLVGVKLIAAFKEILLARSYGVGPLMDAYQFVFQLVSWAPSIFLAIGSAALVPAYAALRAQGGQQLARFRAQVHGASLALGLLLMLAWAALSLATPLLGDWSGLLPAARGHAAALALPMGWLIGVGIVVGLLMAEGIAARLDGVSLLEAVPALFMIATLGLAASFDAGLLIVGSVGGLLAQMALLGVYNTRQIGWARPAFKLDHPHWQSFVAALLTLLVAQLLQATTAIVDQFWAARSGDGAVSVMAYANRLLFVAVGVGATAVTRVVLPLLTDLSIQRRLLARRKALQWAAGLFALSALGVLLLWPASPWIVGLIFERGAFGADDTRRVAAFLQYSWLQLPPTLGALVLIQLALAQSRYRLLALCAGINLAVKLLANAWLAPRLGVNGLALATAAMQGVNLFVLLLWWRASRHD